MPQRIALFARKSAIESSPIVTRVGLFRWRTRNSEGKVVPQVFTIRMLRALACAAASVFFCAALSSAQTAPAAPTAPAIVSAAPPTYREFTDEIGRTIRVPQPVHRIVSLAPSLTETVYALGLQERLVGDTEYCDFPPEAQQKTKVGGAINPSLEAIAALRPDLVLVTKSLNRLETVNALEEIGIPSYATDPHTVSEIISSTQRLAEVLGVPEAGSTLAKDMERRLAETQQRIAPLPPRRVLFIVWRDPLISVGKDTFIADALQRAGATSIVDSSQNWPQLSLEEVVHQQPEFLVFAESHSEAAPPDLEALASLPGWRILDAVRNHRYALISDAVNRPAPRIVSAIEDLAKQLHPEAFVEKQPDLPADKEKTDKPSAAPPGSTSSTIPSSCLAAAAPTVVEASACAC
jgi:iron complex transport system substrate-binding protein